jgi:cytochrome P450
MALQKALARCVFISLIGAALRCRFTDGSFRAAILFFTFILLLLAQIMCTLIYQIFLVPHLSSLRHLPLAPQPSLRYRLFKEPNAFHFERWINDVENGGAIRYFGMLNCERVLFTTPEGVHQILQTHAYNFEKQYAQRTHIQRVSDNGLVVTEGDVHKQQRRIINPAFKLGNIKQVFQPLFWSKTCALLSAMEQDLKRSTITGPKREEQPPTHGVLSMDDYVGRAVFDTIGLASFGHDFQSIAAPERFYRPLHNYRKAFEPSPAMKLRITLAFSLPAWAVNNLPIKFNRTTGASIDQVRQLCNKIIAAKQAANRTIFNVEKPATIQATTPKCLIDTIIAANKLSPRELLDQAMMLQAAGVHTSNAAILSTIWFLAQSQHSHIQDRLRSEIRTALPSCTPKSTLPPSAFDNTPYLDAVRKEVLRLHSAFSSTGRTPIKRTTICNTPLNKGTAISLSPWALHRSFALWGPDAKAFKPERWLDGGVTVPRESCAYIPFGAGPRGCIGERFARAELNCLLAGLFGRFRFRFAEGMQVPGVTQQVTVAFRGEVRVCVEVLEGW